MARRRGIACGFAAAVVAATVATDGVHGAALRHERSPAVLALAGAIAVALLVLAPRLDSRLVTAGCGLAAGGALATLVTGAASGGGVPDPLVGGGVAFNLADVAIAVGESLLLGGTIAYAWRHRSRLHEPV
jgi:lipoprotein signal peptidase